MALTLVIEDGSAKSDSNTYISLSDAETYMEARLHTSTWDDATDPDKNAALVQATRMLDRYANYLGWPTDADQALKWPRYGIYTDGNFYYEYSGLYGTEDTVFSIAADEIPQEIKDAQCELALYLLGADPQAVPDTAGFSEIEVEGAVRLKIDKRDRSSTIPGHVWDMVRHLGSRKGGANVRLMRG